MGSSNTRDALDLSSLPINDQLRIKLMLATKDAEIERGRSDLWQQLAGRYDDIRSWLRVCEDDPAGHAEFYKQCALLIFGMYRDERQEEEEDYGGSVGYHVRIPRGPETVATEVGPRPEGPTARKARHEAWIRGLDTYAKRFHPSARAVAQNESDDHFGFPEWWVVVWMDVSGDDVWRVREFLQAEDYRVSSISVHYEPAMA